MGQSGKEAALQRVRAYLNDAADRTASGVLSAIAVRVSVAEDHFVKVRGLIKDLIQKLKDDAAADATTKGICDKKMKAALEKRDEANSELELASAQIAKDKATIQTKKDEIQDLNDEIAELQKALQEATELR